MRQLKFIMMTTFCCSFLNSSLIATAAHFDGVQYLSIQWFTLFGDMIITSIVTTNLMPYIFEVLDLLMNKCLRKRKRSAKVFFFERKNAQVLNSVFVVFCFGYALPLIFVWVMVPLCVLQIIDKFLIVYWKRPILLQSSILADQFMSIIKYAPLLLLFYGGFIACNADAFANTKIRVIDFRRDQVKSWYITNVNPLDILLWVLFLVLLFCIIAFDCYNKRFRK